MIRLTSLADYAVVLMTAIARAPGQRFSSAQLAETTGIPAPTVAKLLGTLARADLLKASRGVAGGFSLSRAASLVNIAAIVEAVDGPIALTACISDDGQDCAIEGLCGVRSHWGPINAAVRAAFEAVTLADLVKPAGPARQRLAVQSAGATL